jgi:hypothetical protein
MKTLGMLHPTDVLNASDAIGTAVCVAGAAQAFDTPAGAGFVSFSAVSGLDFYVAFGSTGASVPTTSSTAGSTANRSVLNPTARNIGSTQSCTGISIVSGGAGIVVMEWFHG